MLAVQFLLLAVSCSSFGAAESSTGSSFDDYVPYLATSRASRNARNVNKALFYDFFPSELRGNQPNILEIRTLFSVSCVVLLLVLVYIIVQ